MEIASIVNFCTNDYRFLSHCIEGLKFFSAQIVIPVADHFFNGEPENRELLERAYREHPDCEFVEFAYDPEKPYGLNCAKRPKDLDWARHWHSTARMIGYYFLRGEIDRVLFVDVDEIYDGRKFSSWLSSFDFRSYSALRFFCYHYFREARYQSETYCHNGLFADRKKLTPEIILNVDERLGIYNALPGKRKLGVLGLDGLPMIHHYSWVRTKEEMLKKTASWGHHWEKDWPSLIEEEFSQPFRGRDFSTEAAYRTVEPYVDPLLPRELRLQEGKASVVRVTPEEICQRDWLLRLERV